MNQVMLEEWRAVVGLEGRYEVSSFGRVRSLQFRGNCGPAYMRTTSNYAGYYVVSLVDRVQYRVHRLVLEAFVGACPEGMQGCHTDSDKSNNYLDNLRWDTPSGNARDRRSYVGDRNPNARTTTRQRDQIKERRLAGEPLAVLADEYGVSLSRVSQIARGR